MRILFLDQFGRLGGAQFCLLDFLPAVRELGWQAVVAASGDGPLLDLARREGAETRAITLGNYTSGRKDLVDAIRFWRHLPRFTSAIAELLKGTGLIYVNGPRLLPAVAKAARQGTPVIFHSHNRVGQTIARNLAGRALRSTAATVIGSSLYTVSAWAEWTPVERRHVVYNGVADLQRPRRRDGPLVIGVIGRVSAEKGQAIFVDAARLISGECRFLICGDEAFGAAGYIEAVRSRATGLAIEFRGWQDDIGAVLAGMDLLCVPSLEESTSRVILEAYAAGVPVIASRVGGVPEVVQEGVTGFLVTPGSAVDLARGIADALRLGRDHLCQIGAAGRRLWAERFTLDRYRRQLAAIVRETANRTRS